MSGLKKNAGKARLCASIALQAARIKQLAKGSTSVARVEGILQCVWAL